MDVLNVFRAELEADSRPEGFRRRELQLGPALGAEKIGATVYELPPAERSSPYHYEYGREEWVFCLAGCPTLRTPEGERELAPGDVVTFPEGPEGGHQLVNRGPEPARFLMVSTKNLPSVVVYPESGKVAVRAGGEYPILPKRAGVEYWDGE